MALKNNKHFAAVVRETMSRLGLTQADVADRGGPSDTTLRKILDREPVGISPATLKKLDDAFGWNAGSAAATLEGGSPTVTNTIRGRSGEVVLMTYGGEDTGQESLELLRLATIVTDARDNLKKESTPLHRTLARELDEAAELAIRAIAREHYLSGELTEDDIAAARVLADAARAANDIHRQGQIYVIDNEQGDPNVSTPATQGAPRKARKDQKTAADKADALTHPDQADSADDYDLVGRDVGGVSETEMIRRQMDADAERGDI